MEKHVRLSYLLDCYGALLTERQRSMLSQSVEEDCSLAEIAEREGISRQGVRDCIKRAQEQLEEYETKLNVLGTRLTLLEGLKELKEGVDRNTEKETLKVQIQRLMEISENGI